MEENNYLCTANEKITEYMDFKATFKRYNTNISQMAERMGIPQPSLSRQINQGTIDIRQLNQMAEICGVTLGEFIGAELPSEIKVVLNGQEYTYELKK